MATIADDKLDLYYAEKLWQWIPEIYKTEDGRAERPGVLRSIVEVIAEQAAVARRSIDRLHEDPFIELSDDWAVPYIADLVGTRLVSALNRAGRRVDVAKTIFYRRRKGTPSVLETLIRDIARIDGALVESFRRLARMRHGLDNPITPRLEGRFTRTLPGGWADLRNARGAEIVDGPFDEFAHTPDVRPLSGTRGRYNIPKLNFHLYRLEAFSIEGSNPGGSGQRFTFDPSGRDVPLFMRGKRPEPCQLAKPWEVAAPIQCGLLGHAEYELTIEGAVDIGGSLVDPQRSALFSLIGVRFRNEERVLLTLQALDLTIGGSVLAGLFHQFLATALVLESGKAQLVVGGDLDIEKAGAISLALFGGGPILEPSDVASGNLLFWNETPAPKPFDEDVTVVVDAERGRIFFPDAPSGPPDILQYFYGFSGNIGAGPYDRVAFLAEPDSSFPAAGGAIGVIPSSGVRQFLNDLTYTTSGNVTVSGDLTLQVVTEERPYLVNDESPSPAAWVWTATGEPRSLLFEGLWLGIDDGATGERTLALEGDWDTVTVRHSTLDPGGTRLLERDRGVTLTDPPVAVPSVALEIRGTIRHLVIDSSIVGRIHFGASSGSVEQLTVTDSIVQAQPGTGAAIDLPTTPADMARVTIFGDVTLDRLEATEVIVAGTANVTDNQHGCFRFSSALSGSKLPRQFHSPPLEEIPSRVFVSQRFGSPGFAQLRSTAPVDLLRGAENGSEKGAFSALRMPIRLDSLAIKVDEFKPVGLLPQFILET